MTTPTPDILPTQPEPLDNACHQPGHIQTYEIESDLMNDELSFSVYFPPCFDNSGETEYPALYLLHGQTYDDQQWQKLGVAEYADTLILSGRSLPFIIVMLCEKYYYRGYTNNQFPVAILEELLPWVESELHARAGREWRAIGGISRGASWAMHIGLQNPRTFGAIGAHSLPTFKGDMKKLPGWLEALPKGMFPRIYIDIGRSDPELDAAVEFERIVNLYSIPNEWHLNEGRHDMAYWSAHMQEYLDWYTLPWRSQPAS